MVIIGIDPSLTSTGIAVRSKEKYSFHSVITKPAKDRTVKTEIKRISMISAMLINLIKNNKIKNENLIVLIEDYGFQAKGKITKLAELVGILKYRLLTHNMPFKIVSIGTWKKQVLGKGNLKKADIKAKVLQKFGCYFESQDVCDAFCIMRYGELENSLKSLTLPKEVTKNDIEKM